MKEQGKERVKDKYGSYLIFPKIIEILNGI